jgi:hypothetical protein
MSLSRIHAHALAALATLDALRSTPVRASERAVSTLSGVTLALDFSAVLAADLDTYESEPTTLRCPSPCFVSLSLAAVSQ